MQLFLQPFCFTRLTISTVRENNWCWSFCMCNLKILILTEDQLNISFRSLERCRRLGWKVRAEGSWLGRAQMFSLLLANWHRIVNCRGKKEKTSSTCSSGRQLGRISYPFTTTATKTPYVVGGWHKKYIFFSYLCWHVEQRHLNLSSVNLPAVS